MRARDLRLRQLLTLTSKFQTIASRANDMISIIISAIRINIIKVRNQSAGFTSCSGAAITSFTVYRL